MEESTKGNGYEVMLKYFLSSTNGQIQRKNYLNFKGYVANTCNIS